MESINNNHNQDEYMKAYLEYQDICWKIEFKDYKSKTELIRLQNKKDELKKEWNFEEVFNDEDTK